MRKSSAALSRRTSLLTAALAAALPALPAMADIVTDANSVTVLATKGYNGSTGTGVTLNSNLASRLEAIEARAVFDAVNSIDHFSPKSYYYTASNTGSAQAAAAQAAHDVLLSQLPDPAVNGVDARWAQTRTWVDNVLASYLTSIGVAASNPGIQAGKNAAAAAIAARAFDNVNPSTTYGAALTPTSNPGIGLWRQSNAGPGTVNPSTGAPTGFDATGITGKPAIDLNWRDVTPFSLSNRQKINLVAKVPASPEVGSAEYKLELDYVKKIGQDSSATRSADQTNQALYYKQDAEIFVNEVARIASAKRGLTLDQNAQLFALLANAVADARIAAFDSKYEQKFWRPITALNADADGTVTNGYAAWHPLAATPSHPSNTSGHSATVAAGVEVLRAVFGDTISPDDKAVTLGSLAWLNGTNSGTGNVTTRPVSTFSQLQLENGASRIYLGVHYGFDNLQGQLLGLDVADAIIRQSTDPAAAGVYNRPSPVDSKQLKATLLNAPDLYGYFGQPTTAP